MPLERWLAALLLLVAAVGLHYAGPDFWLGIGLWFLAAFGIGLALGRWTALLLASIPWPAGVGIGLLAGRYLFLSDAWEVAAITSLVAGLIGMSGGILARMATRKATKT